MKTINSFDELVEYIKSTDTTLFVRYCAKPRKDIERGQSQDHVTGQWHEGLSVENLISDIWERGHRRYTAMQVSSYSYMRYQGLKGTKAYIFGGECVGRDSDNAPLIANAKLLAVLSDECVEQAVAQETQRVEHGERL
jgi:hypothetical protein